ncbi:MAG TPA: LiaF domain-containing protein [Prolixibacteraceae bacterium]|nr:LiaF domain-containing protein [Prolixibacteraceae bacterium]
MEQTKSDKRFYFGVILICMGVILILEKLNLIPDSVVDVLISFPMLIIVIGSLSYIGGNQRAGVLMMLAGGIFLLPRFLDDDAERLMRNLTVPLILVAVGIAILFRQRGHSSPVFPVTEPLLNGPTGPSDPGATNFSTNSFDDFVIFGGREVFISSQNFTGGKATSIFGGMEFDLRKATISPNGAVIDCVSVFGGCGFKIPMDWNVRNEVTTLFGAFTDKRGETFNERYYDPSKTIVIKGVSIFGGVEVKHF